MDKDILIDPFTERAYYLFDSYSLHMVESTEQRILELQNEINSKLESKGYISFDEYMEIIMKDWSEEDKLKFRMRLYDPEYKGWVHKVGNIEYAFLQVRTDLKEDNKTIIMLEPFPIPNMET